MRSAKAAARWAPAWLPRSLNRRTDAERRMPRDKIILECTECKNRNFFADKNKRKHPERVERRKYCPRCDTHRVHKESK